MNAQPTGELSCVEDVLLDRDQALFRSFLRPRELYAGEVLFWRGEEGGSVYFVADGELSIWREEPNGEQELLRFAEPGSVVSPAALLDESSRQRCCLAERDSRILELTPAAFRVLTALSSDTAISILTALGSLAAGHPDSGDPANQLSWIDQLPSAI